ncbi:hypothetical protein ACFVAJ_17325 [Agromyces sp. NPDC057679]|uniref:hypothetical protein n=1 Tax=Agromyces sp. NPDC057679 TaxID=3346207 RepID=UPI00366DC9CD
MSNIVFVTAGFTVDPDVFNANRRDSIDIEEAEMIVAPFVDEIFPHIEMLDHSGALDGDLYDHDGLDDDEDDRVRVRADMLRHLAVGYQWLITEDGSHSDERKIGSTGLRYVYVGGLTYGDGPFDEYDAVVFLADAVDYSDGLRNLTGILGGGILTEKPSA